MRFRMSSNVAVRTDRYTEAVALYTDVLGFENRLDEADLDASPPTFFVIEDQEISGAVMGCSSIISSRRARCASHKAVK